MDNIDYNEIKKAYNLFYTKITEQSMADGSDGYPEVPCELDIVPDYLCLYGNPKDYNITDKAMFVNFLSNYTIGSKRIYVEFVCFYTFFKNEYVKEIECFIPNVHTYIFSTVHFGVLQNRIKKVNVH